MSFTFLVFLILLVTNSVNSARLNVISDSDCFPFKDEPNTLTCRSVPSCNERAIFASKYTRFIFDLENSYDLFTKQFFNCTFFQNILGNQVDFNFKNIKILNSYTFDSILFRENFTLNLKFDGAGLNLDKNGANSKLTINKNTFNNILFERNSRLNVEIKNYDLVECGDMLVDKGDVIWQQKNSEINFDFKNTGQLIFMSNLKINEYSSSDKEDQFDDYNGDDEYSSIGSTLPEADKNIKIRVTKTIVDQYDKEKFTFKSNLTNTLFVSNVNSLVFEESFFSKIHINPYSNWIIQIKFIKSLLFGRNLFDTLMLGYNANFNLFVENVNTIGMDKFMFHGMQQEKYSVFYFYLEKIGSATSPSSMKTEVKATTTASSNIDERNVDGDISEDEQENDVNSASSGDEYFSSNQNIWLCLPEGLFDNVIMSDSTITQVHFTQVELSISVSNHTFKDITLGENSKFQLMFQDLKGHVIFDEGAINMIRMGDGQFEIWIDNQKQKDTIIGNPVTNQSYFSRSSKSPTNPFKLLTTDVKNNYLKFMPKSINKIYVTPRSSFRLAFQSSNSISLLNFLSINEFHLDRFKSQVDRFNQEAISRDFRTKLEIDLNHDSPNVMLDFLTGHSDESEFFDDSSSTLPKLIELDGYKPIVSILQEDGSLKAILPDDNHNENSELIDDGTKLKKKKKKLYAQSNLDQHLLDEICQFYKIRPFMTSFKQTNTLKSHLIYFKETTESDLVKRRSNLSCTSCFMIYLYRHIHRRGDFFFVKDHLPPCFIRLHFNIEKAYLLNSINKKERENYVSSIEESFKFYWKLLGCKKLTGLALALTNDGESNLSDDSLKNYEIIKKQCGKQDKLNNHEIDLVAAIDPRNIWHEKFSERICLKNLFDSKLTRSLNDEYRVGVGLRKSLVKTAKPTETKPKLAIAVFILFLISLSSIIAVILHYRFKRTNQTCLRLKLGRGGDRGVPGFQRLNNNHVTKYNGHSVNISNKQLTAMNITSNQISDDNDEEPNNGEASYDAYEYDDEFEVNNNDTETGHDGSDVESDRVRRNSNYLALNEENVDFKVLDSGSTRNSINSLTNKSIRHMKRLKSNFLNKDVFKSGLLSNIKKMSYSNYSSYKSTDGTDGMSHEFELRKGTAIDIRDSNQDDVRVVIATYNVKNKSKQNVVRKKGADDESTEGDSNEMRLATNPLDDLDEYMVDDEFESVENKNTQVTKRLDFFKTSSEGNETKGENESNA